jgi:hypothetical protein
MLVLVARARVWVSRGQTRFGGEQTPMCVINCVDRLLEPHCGEARSLTVRTFLMVIGVRCDTWLILGMNATLAGCLDCLVTA